MSTAPSSANISYDHELKHDEQEAGIKIFLLILLSFLITPATVFLRRGLDIDFYVSLVLFIVAFLVFFLIPVLGPVFALAGMANTVYALYCVFVPIRKSAPAQLMAYESQMQAAPLVVVHATPVMPQPEPTTPAQ